MGLACPPLFQQPCGVGPPPEEGITPREQNKSWDPNCCLLTSLIKTDLHFYEWLAAGRKENSNRDASRQRRAGRGRRGRGWLISPCPSSAILDVCSGLSLLFLSLSLGLSENTALSSRPPTHTCSERCANMLQTPSGSVLAMQSGRAATGVLTRGCYCTAGDNLSRVLRPGLWDGRSGRACCARPPSHQSICPGFGLWNLRNSSQFLFSSPAADVFL